MLRLAHFLRQFYRFFIAFESILKQQCRKIVIVPEITGIPTDADNEFKDGRGTEKGKKNEELQASNDLLIKGPNYHYHQTVLGSAFLLTTQYVYKNCSYFFGFSFSSPFQVHDHLFQRHHSKQADRHSLLVQSMPSQLMAGIVVPD